MSKRFLLATILVALVAGGTFAQVPLSIGGGSSMRSGKAGVIEATERTTGISGTVGLNEIGFGNFFFVDTGYLETAIGVEATVAELRTIGKLGNFSVRENLYGPIISMDVSLLYKFPIEASERITFFPLLGMGYNIVLFAKMYDDDDNEVPFLDDAMDLNTLRYMGGFGFDVNFENSLFLRVETLGYIGLPSKFFREGKRDLDREPDLILTSNTFLNPYGIICKVAFGYRF